MEYGGMGWERAKEALSNLLDRGFINYGDSYTKAHPRYELRSHRELFDDGLEQSQIKGEAGSEGLERSGRHIGQNDVGNSLGGEVEGMTSPPGCKEQNHAETDADLRQVLNTSGIHSLWLPNELVTRAVIDRESPIRLLRGADCRGALHLFVSLYSEQNLRDDGGISPQLLRQDFDRLEVGRHGRYTIWAFRLRSIAHRTEIPFLTRFQQVGKTGACSFSDSVSLLQDMGLLSFVPHIFENDSQTAEPLHPFGVGGAAELPLERDIGDAAIEAARSHCAPSTLRNAIECGFQLLCPVSNTKPSPQMIGVARLTFRPNTRRTTAG